MSSAALYPRFLQGHLTEALSDTPVVLIHGPRQCGKTTLAQVIGEELGYRYLSFDDNVALQSATEDPAGFVDGLPDRVILDEVQRAPSIFSALKRAVDRDRSPGRFILTGSANVLLVPRLADSLAGRMEILRLHPLAQVELRRKRTLFLEALFAGRFGTRQAERLGTGLLKSIVAGGYPEALTRKTPRRRSAWYLSYIETIVQRDVRDLARISSLDSLPRLLRLAAGQTAQLFNQSSLAAGFQLSRPTIRDYLTLLERVFLLETVQPWHSNRLRRLIKTPKLHLGDTGVACALLGMDASALEQDREVLGHLLETFVFQDLRRQASWADKPISFYHFRDRDGTEVDIVLEQGTRIAGLEVKASATVTQRDFSGLRRLQGSARSRFAAGVVLYDGESSGSFGDRLFAVPIRALWDEAFYKPV